MDNIYYLMHLHKEPFQLCIAWLRLHSLKGKLVWLYSVSINLKYRITLEMIITEKEIILVNVGDHSQVY
jgi:plasmid maintenance system killer protein